MQTWPKLVYKHTHTHSLSFSLFHTHTQTSRTNDRSSRDRREPKECHKNRLICNANVAQDFAAAAWGIFIVAARVRARVMRCCSRFTRRAEAPRVKRGTNVAARSRVSHGHSSSSSSLLDQTRLTLIPAPSPPSQRGLLFARWSPLSMRARPS